MKRILFVCMGNICRSPSAQGVFQSLLQRHGLEQGFDLDSAGTHGYHQGAAPDPRAQAAAARRGIDISTLVARQVAPRDFDHFDLIVAMDEANLSHLQGMSPPELHHKLSLMLSWSAAAPDERIEDVPDPYYGGEGGFERVLDLLEDAAEAMLERLRDDV